jgi:hypothetical protein
MPGASMVSYEWFAPKLAELRTRVAALRGGALEERRRVSFLARCLMRADCAEASELERDEAERLIDESAGLIARRCHYCRTGEGAACNCV